MSTPKNHAAVPQPEGSPYLVSRRGKPLLNLHPPKEGNAITLENYAKWYHVHMVKSTGEVFEIDVDLIMLASDQSGRALWVDHCYHPELLLRIAKLIGEDAFVDDIVLNAAAGRWVIEIQEKNEEFSYCLPDEED